MLKYASRIAEQMPLSRHFYSLDELQAALLYSSYRSNINESLFWSQELILSGNIGEATSTLFESWLWYTGPYRLQWLIDAWKTLASDEVTEDDILLATFRLASTASTATHDNSIWSILVLHAQNPDAMPDRVTPKTPAMLPSDDTKAEEIYFFRALFQGKARSAWWISCHFKEERVWELLDLYACHNCSKYYNSYRICLEALQNYDKLLGYKSAEYDVIVRCMAVLSLCIRPDVQCKSFKHQAGEISEQHDSLLKEWSQNIGQKSRRIYSIPNMCLYGITPRGRSQWSQHNLVQLNNVEKYLLGCPFWDEAISEYAEINSNNKDDDVIKWKSDNAMEEFYNKYFPDDIPDEWSMPEKRKSHGDGILSPNDKPNIWKYSRNHLMKPQRLAWGCIRDANTFLHQLDFDSVLTKVIEINKIPAPIINKTILEPVRRIKIIY